MAHSHKCDRCGTLMVCHAGRVDNYDGWPEVLCSAEAAYVTFVCEDCEDLVSCANCGEWHPDGELRKDDGYLYCLSCYYALDSVVAGLVAEAKADEGRDDDGR